MDNLSPAKNNQEDEQDDIDDEEEHKPLLLIKKSSSKAKKVPMPEPINDSDEEEDEIEEDKVEKKDLKETAFFKESKKEDVSGGQSPVKAKKDKPKTESELMIGHLSELNKQLYKCISDLQLEKIT